MKLHIIQKGRKVIGASSRKSQAYAQAYDALGIGPIWEYTPGKKRKIGKHVYRVIEL